MRKQPPRSFANRNISCVKRIFLCPSRYLATCVRNNGPAAHAPQARSNAELFEYTTGRWIFNEELRRSERRLSFNLEALTTIIAQSVKRSVAGIVSLDKLAEGGFNRILQAKFEDGLEVLARLPYPLLAPKHYAVASEAATLNYLRSIQVPVPKVLNYSATADNPVGSEYIILEKIHGACLGNIWFIIDNKARKKLNQEIVNIEEKLLRSPLPASGSLYHLLDLGPNDGHVPLDKNALRSDQIVVGPTAQYEWHYNERTSLRRHMGPWRTYLECFEAPARRELEWCDTYGRPRQHVERHLRELHDFQELSPATHKQVLLDYLKLAPSLDIPSAHMLSRPVLRHPDLSPNNILVNESYEIVGLIDWQHAKILPLCLAAGIPKHFQNWGDPESQRLSQPLTDPPPNIYYLPPAEQAQTQELLRRRLVHFLYAAKTLAQIPEHFDAFKEPGAVSRARLYEHATWPWEGDSVTLKHDIALAVESWPLDLKPSSFGGEAVKCGPCPLAYSPKYITLCKEEYERQAEKSEEIGEMRDALDIDQQGWVPDDEHQIASRNLAQEFKTGMLEEAVSDKERKAISEHFPFEDHDEK